jgi:lactoylglutathione lyase
MGNEPGGVAIGVGTADVVGEHKSLSAIGGTDLDLEPRRTPGAPLLSGLRDPDGNRIFVVETMGSALEHGPTRLQTPAAIGGQ